MKKSSTLFLQAVIILIGIGVLIFMLVEPHFEGRNVNVTTFQIYFNDPFLTYVYLVSIAFFTALYQIIKFLGLVGRSSAFSPEAVKTLRIVKYCALTLAAFILGAEVYFFVFQRGKDDIAGGVMLGLLMIIISLVVAATSAVFEKVLQSGVDMKYKKI